MSSLPDALPQPVLTARRLSRYLSRMLDSQPWLGAALAESIEEIKNVCSCGRKATMNIRCDAEGKRLREGPQILIGDANYRQSCACCFYTD